MKFQKGHKQTEDIKSKISSTMKGRKLSEEHRRKLSEVHKGKPRPYCAGEKNWNWKGGNNSQWRIKNAPRPKPDNCEICGAMGKIFLDHNHKTGKFRGWICMRCNFAIGMIKDNTGILQAMIDYLANQTR